MSRDRRVSRRLVVAGLLFSCAVAAASEVPVRRLAERAPAEKVGPRLTELSEAYDPDRVVTVLADLPVQVDLRALGERMSADGLSRDERAAAVRSALSVVARREQTALTKILETWRAHGTVRSWRGVRIVNRVILEAPVHAIPRLAASPAIARLWDGERPRPVLGPRRPVSLAGGTWSRELRRKNWALEALGVASLWRQRRRGRGVVVGILDTGVDGDHPQLASNWRRENGWFDPVAGRPRPWDSAGHGTEVLGCAVARNRRGYRIGVAPRATWVAALANPEGLFHLRHFTAAADWMLFHGRPDVLLMAFGFEPGACHDDLRPFVDAFRAAEIFCVFAAGNEGPRPGTDISPANYTGLYPGDGVAFAVGGVERDRRIYPRSGAGPGSCGGGVYPVAVAPAGGLPVTVASEIRYDWRHGTSFAAGYAAGVVALAYQARRDVLLPELEAALVETARDLGPTGPDHRHGHGLLSPEAVSRRLENGREKGAREERR